MIKMKKFSNLLGDVSQGDHLSTERRKAAVGLPRLVQGTDKGLRRWNKAHYF
jgi:hypothetical protein